jgi:RNA polymerase sigma factor (sigma-70 family)
MNGSPNREIDSYLVVLAQGGSREAVDQLVRRWTPRLIRYVGRTAGSPDAARDVVQEVWIAAIRGLNRLGDSHEFPAWIYSIAHRRCVDFVRAASRRRKLLDRAQLETAALPVDVEPETPDLNTGLTAAISQLSEEHRAVIHLFYGEDLSVNEISVVLAISAGTVKSRLFNAREILRKQLGE